jgi:hypothetical protein
MADQPQQPQTEQRLDRNRPLYAGTGTVPVPDPTALTAAAVQQATEQMRRELAAATALAAAESDGVRRVFEARLHGMDEAVKLIQSWRDRLPAEFEAKVKQLELLHDERFKTVEERFGGVGLQFRERDTRSERESRDNKVAVDAAFAAQKEAASEQNKSNTLAIDKSERATAETLNKQADLVKSTTDALDDKINALKETYNKMDSRLTSIESRGLVGRETQSSNLQSSNYVAYLVFGGIGLLVGAAGLIVAILKP